VSGLGRWVDWRSAMYGGGRSGQQYCYSSTCACGTNLVLVHQLDALILVEFQHGVACRGGKGGQNKHWEGRGSDQALASAARQPGSIPVAMLARPQACVPPRSRLEAGISCEVPPCHHTDLPVRSSVPAAHCTKGSMPGGLLRPKRPV